MKNLDISFRKNEDNPPKIKRKSVILRFYLDNNERRYKEHG